MRRVLLLLPLWLGGCYADQPYGYSYQPSHAPGYYPPSEAHSYETPDYALPAPPPYPQYEEPQAGGPVTENGQPTNLAPPLNQDQAPYQTAPAYPPPPAQEQPQYPDAPSGDGNPKASCDTPENPMACD
jgi:hypothetical protein